MGISKKLQDYSLISGQSSTDDGRNIIDIRDQFVDRLNTLEFYRNSGDVIFIDKSGVKHKGHFSPRDNGYLLLEFLIHKPSKLFTAEEIEKAKILNDARGFSSSTADRRVRDTIQTIRKVLGLVDDKTNDLFIVDKGFGLGCKVKINP